VCNQKVLHNLIVPSCGYPPLCQVTTARMREAFYLIMFQKLDAPFLCFPQANGLGKKCQAHWIKNFHQERNVTTMSLNQTWGTWDDTLRSVAEAEKFAKENCFDTVHHYLVSDPTQLWRMWLICKCNGIENIHRVSVYNSGRPWRDIFPHEVYSYGKVFLKGSRVLLKRIWEYLN